MRFLPKSTFWKNVFTLALGTSLAQLIPILISPVLTQLYTPEQFGIYGLYFSCTMVLSVIICGRYEMAILLPEKDEERINLLALCIIIAVIVTAFLLIVIYFWNGWIATILKNESIKSQLNQFL
jgi:O-antigen/teichoic acid export membrane protein